MDTGCDRQFRPLALSAAHSTVYQMMNCQGYFEAKISKGKTAGGRPAASYFLLLRQKESNQRKCDPGLPPLRGSLDQPQASGAAQLDLVGRTPAPHCGTRTVLA